MNKDDDPRMRRIYLEWLLGALILAVLVALVRALF
jgi:hypothetical protein